MTAQTSPRMQPTRRSALLIATACVAALGLTASGCGGDSVSPTIVTPKVVVRSAFPATVKAIPLKSTVAQVLAKIGPPQTIQHLTGEAHSKKTAKTHPIKYDLYTYGVKGAGPNDTIEMSFVKGKLASVLVRIAKKATPGDATPAIP